MREGPQGGVVLQPHHCSHKTTRVMTGHTHTDTHAGCHSPPSEPHTNEKPLTVTILILELPPGMNKNSCLLQLYHWCPWEISYGHSSKIFPKKAFRYINKGSTRRRCLWLSKSCTGNHQDPGDHRPRKSAEGTDALDKGLKFVMGSSSTTSSTCNSNDSSSNSSSSYLLHQATLVLTSAVPTQELWQPIYCQVS